MKSQIAFDHGPVCVGSSYKDLITKKCVKIGCDSTENNLCGLVVKGKDPAPLGIQNLHQSVQITVLCIKSIVLQTNDHAWFVNLFEHLLVEKVRPENLSFDVLLSVLSERNGFIVSILPRDAQLSAWLFLSLSSTEIFQRLYLDINSRIQRTYNVDLCNVEITNIGQSKNITCSKNEEITILDNFSIAVNESQLVYQINKDEFINAKLDHEELLVMDLSNELVIMYSYSRVKIVRRIESKGKSQNVTSQSAIVCCPLPKNCELSNVNVIKHRAGEIRYECKKYDAVLGVCSLVGNSLSVVALTATLFTFAKFPRLRTKGMKYTSCLCFCLLVSQTTMLISPFVVSQLTLCRIFTVIQHLSLLMAFSFMALISLAIVKTFSSSDFGDTGSFGSFHFAAVMMWPLVFVTVSLVLANVPRVRFDYWRSDICWLDPGYALIFGFALPVAVVLLFNTVCFAITTKAIFDHRQNAALVGSQLTNVNMAKVHVKLALLMGLTWIFGFLSNVEYLVFLEYIFVLFNTFQGVFIFIAFILTPDVLKQYKLSLYSLKGRTDDNSKSTEQNKN